MSNLTHNDVPQTAAAPIHRGGVEPADLCGDVVARAQVGAAAVPRQARRRPAAAVAPPAADAAVAAAELAQLIATPTSKQLQSEQLSLTSRDKLYGTIRGAAKDYFNISFVI